jgi:hypothetical protein
MGAVSFLSGGRFLPLDDGFDQNELWQVSRVEQASAAITAVDIGLDAASLDTPMQHTWRQPKSLPRLTVCNQPARVHSPILHDGRVNRSAPLHHSLPRHNRKVVDFWRHFPEQYVHKHTRSGFYKPWAA